jgi:Flp pilus assembly pilin Flp
MQRRAGQATVEYMLVISVLSIAIAAVLYGLYGTLASATAGTGSSMVQSLTTGGTQ